MAEQEKDRLLEHDADGIKEYDNALPRWWLYGFYFTIVWSAIYLVNFHVLSTPWFGVQGQEAEYAAEVAEAKALYPQKPASAAAVQLLTDEASIAKGKEIFEGAGLCATCHRADLGGMVGPNLTDDNWIHGCDFETIAKNITTGFPEKGMLPYGSGTKLSDAELSQVASYVVYKRGSNPPDPKPLEEGRDKPCTGS